MKTGQIVILHATAPSEKFWGVLEHLGPEGVTVRGVSVVTFDDWMRDAAKGGEALGVTSLFVPLFRVERMFLDERVGEVESYRERFERHVGITVEAYLGGASPSAGETPAN